MAYLQITEKCNMSCQHCCFSCTKRKGEHMSWEVMTKAVEIINDYGESLSIGGGEPTCHPRFWDFLHYIEDNFYQAPELLWMATNGKKTKDALRLAEYAREGRLGVRLSLDKWHEPIDPEVVAAFKKDDRVDYWNRNSNDMRDSTDANNTVVSLHGRAKDLYKLQQSGEGDYDLDLVNFKNTCACDTLFFAPNGDIFHCGCKTIQYGTVFNPQIPKDFSEFERSYCREEEKKWKNVKQAKTKMELLLA